MQRYSKHLILSVLLISLLLLPAHPSFSQQEDEPQLLPPSHEFLEWQRQHTASSSSLPANNKSLPDDGNPAGYIPIPVDLSYLADNLPDESKASPVPNNKADSLPSTFDLRNVNGNSYVPSVKNQRPYESCWSFAAIGAMESNLMMQRKPAQDLSEMHLAWFTFRNSDKSKAFDNMHNSSFKAVLNHGGNSFYPVALYSRLAGPVLESAVPYGEEKQPSAQTPESYNRVLRLRDVYYLSMSSYIDINASTSARDIVKRRIMSDGAVVANYYSDNGLYSKTASGGSNYYTTVKNTTNHAVQIIGWDDNYSRSNFKNTPSTDGAWLIKNSWGNTWNGGIGDEGYFWMSYATYLSEGSSFIVEETNPDMKAYYYDALGWCGSLGYNGSSIYAANVFRAERDGEKVVEVGVHTPDNNLSYEVYVFSGLKAMPSSSPVPSGQRLNSPNTSGTLPYAGYHVITLNDAVEVTKGEYFSVIVKFKGTNKIPVEKRMSGFSDNITIEEGSFFSPNGTRWQTGRTNNVNATVKAFTVTSGVAPRIADGYPPDASLDSPYSAEIIASGTQPFTWSARGLPEGLSIAPSTGEISGTPAKEGNYTFEITVKNEFGSSSKFYTVNVWDVPAIKTSSFTGYAGFAFTGQLELSQAIEAKFAVTEGKLPAGLSLNASTGAITGKPSRAGSYDVTFSAATAPGTSSRTVAFNINPKPVKPAIRTSTLKAGTIDEAYSEAVVFTGTEPVTLSATGLPGGLSLNYSTGNISGTPTATGTFSIKVTASNIATELSGSSPAAKNIKLVINAQPPEIDDSVELENAIMGTEYTPVQFSLTKGTAPVTWTASGVPSGMSVSSSGLLSGTPTRAGKFNINLRVTNAGGKATLKVSLIVLQKPAIASIKLADGVTDKRYSARLTAKGSTPITWEVEGLPETLELVPNATGTAATISGTPVEMGTYELKITAENEAGITETAATLKVNGVAPKLTASLARGKAGTDYEGSKLYATGTKPITISYSIADSDKTKFGIDDLEDLGLEFEANPDEGTATITGIPEKSIRALPITFSAMNAAATNPATRKVSLTIAGDKPAFTSPEESSINLTQEVNSEVEMSFSVTGTPDIVFTMDRVNGFTLTQNGDEATLTGTAPARDGKLNFTVTAANADGKATRKITIVTKTRPEITTETLPAGTLNKSYSAKLAATGTKTIRWELEGTLPSGMTFTNGTLRGRPEEAGEFELAITAANDIGSDTKTFTLSIPDPNIGALPEIQDDISDEEGTVELEAPEADEQKAPEIHNEVSEPAITFGTSRTINSLSRSDIEKLKEEGYEIAAVLPEIKASVSGLYDLETELDAEAGKAMYWFAFPVNAKPSDDDEIAEFYDDTGAEISGVPENHKVVISVWLNEGVTYAPVIAVK